ncbi:MAG: cell division protein ZipA [Xanthomonadales bacterium]|nr:cell division protein ZipA [Xanthomonadales bacterium]NIN60769.1 cell division protein ZipA [Xanthomonadales bacterium]NIN76131.1 cell division protein ZipA [Xanthomonadales bacterium]NIO15352.1 cell division protein ZipA [Xanthomonadales bacterium]NIP13162.1 cell division protein ZipA [Xanthomonadales bacterium]
MDITTFRWILIILGVLIIAGIILFGHPQKKRQPRASRRRNRRTRGPQRARREPVLLDEEDAEVEPAPAGQGQLDIGVAQSTPSEPQAPPAPPPEKIVTLYLQARDNHRISGVDLLDAALKAGMVFGVRDIFHRTNDDGEIIFSMANLTEPGYFDKSAWNSLETIGVTLFMTLPGPLPAIDAWNSMLATSRRVAELLHADLLDEQHSAFTRQREGQIREELRSYDRDKLPES